MALRDEILEQQDTITALLKKQSDPIQSITQSIGKPSGVFIAARGTSDNAARYAKYAFGFNNQIPVALAAPSLFSIYHKPPNLGENLVIGISQSGESPDLLAVLSAANQQGCSTLAITNQSDSPLANEADHVIDIQAGPELSVAATKSYTAQLGAIAMLSAAWAGNTSLWDQLAEIPGFIKQLFQQENQIQSYAARYRDMDQCAVLGRGFNYATAYEWSLKLKELAYVGAQPYSSADFRHGPIALVSSGFPIFAVAPQGEEFEDMTLLLKKLKDTNRADLFIISENQDLLQIADCPLSLPAGISGWLSPMVSIIPAQLFSYHLTLIKGIDPDAPRGLTKVTLTK
jgi:glutamine---fructose-6-phosphate transaminase (isomerizing)